MNEKGTETNKIRQGVLVDNQGRAAGSDYYFWCIRVVLCCKLDGNKGKDESWLNMNIGAIKNICTVNMYLMGNKMWVNYGL